MSNPALFRHHLGRVIALLLAATSLLAAALVTPSVADARKDSSPRISSQPGLGRDLAHAKQVFPGADPRALRQQAVCTPPAKLGVVFLVDNSGSMSGADPNRLRGNAIQLGLQELGTAGAATAIGFSSSTSTIFPTTDLATTPPPTHEQIQAGIDDLSSTDYVDAFSAARTALSTFGPDVDQKVVVLLSDGAPTDRFDAATDLAGLGARVYPIGFGAADNSVLGDIATLTGGINQAANDAVAVQGAIARAIAAIRCQPIDVPETFEVGPGQTRSLAVNVPANTAKLSAYITWAGEQGITVGFVRPDGSTLVPGSTLPTESYVATPSSVRVGAAPPAAGSWLLVVASSRANKTPVTVSIDLLGGAVQDHPMESRPTPLRPGCETEIIAGGQVAWSQCFTQTASGWSSSVPVRVAGIDFRPLNGKTIDFKLGQATAQLVSADAEMSVYARTPIVSGRIPLKQSGSITVPIGGPTLHFKLNPELKPDEPKHKKQPQHKKQDYFLAGVPISTEPGIALDWAPGGATLSLALDVSRRIEILVPPRQVDQSWSAEKLKRGWGVEIKLYTSNAKGIAVDSVSGQINSAKVFGALAVDNVFVSYSAKDNILKGGGAVKLFGGPLAKHGLPTISASLGMQLQPLDFANFDLTVSDINKPVGPYVYLQKLGGSISQLPAPWTVSGTAGITLGPEIDVPLVGKVSAIGLDGTAGWSYPATLFTKSQLSILGMEATETNLTANLLTPEATYSSRVRMVLGGTGLDAKFDGWLHKKDFQLTGDGGMMLAGSRVSGAEGFINNSGFGGCRRGWGPDYGFRWSFRSKTPHLMASSCDFGGMRKSAKRSQLGGPLAVPVPAGRRGYMLQVTGVGAQPLATLRGPDGTAVAIGPDVGFVETPKVAAVPEPGANTVWVVLNQPAGGNWVLEPRPGSAPLAVPGVAAAKPPVRIQRAKLRRSGGKLRLSFKVKRSAGEQLVVTESGPGGNTRTVLKTAKRSGVVTFPRMEGPAGQRVVTAAIEAKGVVRTSKVIATYSEKRAVRPGRARSVRVKRTKRGAKISWTRPRGGQPLSYRVRIELKDGRTIEQTVRRTKLTLAQMDKGTRGKVRVYVLGRSGLESKRAKATLPRYRKRP